MPYKADCAIQKIFIFLHAPHISNFTHPLSPRACAKRNPWKHVVAICYVAKKVGGQIKAKSKEGDANFFKINQIPKKLAFDHTKMIKDHIVIRNNFS
jgi:ADP-ribose pyrophosphatase YjhB (NUDIX family)